jgi:glycosyltransferase involved in cell wall biosynthesis
MNDNRIILIANSLYPNGSANSINVFRMLSAFNKNNYKVSLIAKKNIRRSNKKIWKLVQDDYGEKFPISVFLIWYPFLRFSEPFIAFISMFYLVFQSRKNLVYTRVRYVAFIASLLHFQTLFESHSPPIKSFSKLVDIWLEKRSNCKFILISMGLKDSYLIEGVKLQNPIIAPDAGRDLRKCEPSKKDFNGGISDVGYIGSMYSGRGIEIILELAGLFNDKRFHLIGDMTSLSYDRPFPSNVILYGKVTPNQAELILTLFDLLLMPYQDKVSVKNGMDTSKWMSPLKLFEYMLSGTPVISSDISVLKEVLKDKKNAYLVKADKVNEWCDAIKDLEDGDKRYEIAKNAYIMARENYTWEKRVGRILNHSHLN